MMKGKRIQSSAKSLQQRQIIAHWDDSNTAVFVRLCAEQVHLGNRRGTHLNNKGWDEVIASFQRITKQPYTYQQLKYRFDVLKCDWIAWQDLVGKETGLSRDPATGAITAPDSWWAQKMMFHRAIDVQKFRHKPLLEEDDMAVIFRDITATGEFSYSPNSGRSPPHSSDGSPQDSSDNLRSNSGGHESPVMSPVSSSTTPIPMAGSSKQIKGVESSKRRRWTRATLSPSESDDLTHALELFRKALGEFDATSPKSKDKTNEEAYSIDECMRVVMSIDAEVVPQELRGGNLEGWAAKILEKPTKRKVFMSIKTNVGRVKWIQIEKQFAEEYGLGWRRMANNTPQQRIHHYPPEPSTNAHFVHPYQSPHPFPHRHFSSQPFRTPQHPYTPQAYPFPLQQFAPPATTQHRFAPPFTTQQQSQPCPPTSSPSQYQPGL